ncbi:pyridine nucleotide-disulfide oxidoreductase [Rhodopirellula sallentina SM41]|uniref:Pyridine nucleotide-disulfide oxidoreductase n=2 Tax=Rhodopirellula TaxID=265488 RepID=M5TSB5_9BACT|nr:pyridine nucleotide-disulfide oxidoreductase [Rhodopirellula sallentina SM41]
MVEIMPLFLNVLRPYVASAHGILRTIPPLLAIVSASVMSAGASVHAEEVPDEILVETESFTDRGGWQLDTQFIEQMGSPYLLAHGLGRPVEDARTTISVAKDREYRVWVRTLDWVARWGAAASPGQFQVLFDGAALQPTFGTESPVWDWQDGGVVRLSEGEHEIRLHDLTGFDGRCDCLFLTSDVANQTPPPNVNDVLSPWRRERLGLPAEPVVKGPYDLVVVGGGYSGMGAALSAARMGCRVALIQDRGVLGGNGSSEVRVWAMGNIRRGKFPRIGEIIEEFCDHASKSPGTYEEFGDDKKEAIVLAESNIDLMLHHFAYGVEARDTAGAHGGESNAAATVHPHTRHMDAVRVLNTQTGEDLRVTGDRFVDCTGHGWIGEWAGAETEMTPKGRMGMSNMWRWDEADTATSFPETPWALDLKMADFPYPRDHHGQWFWESGFDLDPINNAEAIRDWNLRAVYGAFNAMKNRDGASDHANAELTWVAYVGGPRESRRLMGDVVLTQEDVVAKRDFPDGCVPSTWSIDLHYPKKQYAQKYPKNPFISHAVHDRRVDRSYGYPVPYRCFYSRNVDNLFMAGRCISVTHEALGTVRVMKTCGMMGEVVGKAASLCTLHDCTPRDIYEAHLDELLELLRLPGKAHRSSPSDEIVVPDDAMEEASSIGPMSGRKPSDLPGLVIDDREAIRIGRWKEGGGLRGYVGWSYRYASPNSDASARFETKMKEAGRYRLQLYNQPHSNRGGTVPVTVEVAGKAIAQLRIDQRVTEESGAINAGEFDLPENKTIGVVFSTENAGGIVHIDAIGWERLE